MRSFRDITRDMGRGITGGMSGNKARGKGFSLPWVAATPIRPEGAPLPEKPRGAEKSKWGRSPSIRLARSLIIETAWRPIVKTFARPNRRGLDRLSRLDKKRPAIFISNHNSHADTPLILTSLPAPWRYKTMVAAARDYFFDTKAKGGFFTVIIGAFPIERTKADKTSTALTGNILKEGWSILIYPEGTRGSDSEVTSFHKGAAHLACRYDVPIVPIYIKGSAKILPKGKFFPQVSESSIVFGQPLYPAEGEKSKSFSPKVEKAVETLRRETESDWWQALRQSYDGKPHDGSHDGSHDGEIASQVRGSAGQNQASQKSESQASQKGSSGDGSNGSWRKSWNTEQTADPKAWPGNF